MILIDFMHEHYIPYTERTLKFRTSEEYGRLIFTALEPLLPKEMGSLTMLAIEAWHAKLSKKAPVQANRALAVLSAAMGYAAKRGIVPANPASGVRRNRETAKGTFLSPEQAKKLISVAAAWDDPRSVLVRLLLLTGARPSELVDSMRQWRGNGAIRLPDSKTGARTIYLSPEAEALLDGLPERSDGRYFPPGMDVRRAWDRLAREAELPGVRLYDLRHSFASAALAADVELAVIGQLLGHKKHDTTLRYAHLSADTAVDAATAAARRMMS